jgi:hypothetical protein
MKFINIRVHGYLDYIYGVLLAISPWLFGFSKSPEPAAETYIPLFLGAFTIVYSLFTDYELGMYRIINIRTHLAIDMFLGLFLVASPWVFNFEDGAWLSHVTFGLLAILTAMFTSKRRSARHA